MKLLITGDIHGRNDILEGVLKREKQIDYHLNTGDLGLDIKTIEASKMIAVRGNNDIFLDLPLMRVLDLEGVKILLTHGHIQNVKYGLNALVQEAKSQKVSICIYGHTHEASYQTIDGIIFLNPGALGEFKGKSYAVYKDGEITFVKID